MMRVTQRERKAGASSAAFTLAVVCAILACIGLMVWRVGAGDPPNAPGAFVQSR
jgi:hypothetical protein